MLRLLGDLYLPNRIFQFAAGIAVVFVLAFPFPALFLLAQLLLLLLGIALGVDMLLLWGGNIRLEVERELPAVFSLGDETIAKTTLANRSSLSLYVEMTEELPAQFQLRDTLTSIHLATGQQHPFQRTYRPTERGVYRFGEVQVFAATTLLGLAQRRFRFPLAAEVAVYPSIVQMKKYELKAFKPIATFQGIKKVRRLGHSYEFEQIRNYVQGDDYRTINWKATGRRSTLMVNQYDEERSQQVYIVLDKSRAMRLPFDGLTLLDHAINAALAIANIALLKYDRAGLLTFSDKIGSIIKADSSPRQLRLLLDVLYKEQERETEANYELLFAATRQFLTRRSLILLFANFESVYAMERALPILRQINRSHLLVVIFFENTAIADFGAQPAEDLAGIYLQTVARKFAAEKILIAQQLQRYGIQTVLTRPEDLSVNTINKYLELKSRGLI